ncbi:MAG: Matrixin [Isosphaeraceae bacterium]
MLRRSNRAVLLVLIMVAGPSVADDGPPADATEPPPIGDFLVIPLHVHLLSADDAPDLHSRLESADVRRVVGKVNRIWNLAGIHWGLASIDREPVANLEAFRARRGKDPDGQAPLPAYRDLRPEGTRGGDGLHVYYLHKFSVNGVYLNGNYAFVQDSARLRQVEGGIDEPIPRVTAHELGHALGLRHREDRVNLLASGTTGTRLNAREVETARDHARRYRGARSWAEVRDQAEAEEAKQPRTARLLWSWLSEIPGVDRPAIQARIDSLPADDEPIPGRSATGPEASR